MRELFRRLSAAALGVVALSVLATAASAQTMGSPERYTANAINMNVSASGPIEIVVDRWSSDADRDKLMTAMVKAGPEKLLDTLQDLPRMGYFRVPGELGIDIHFARKVPSPDGGERVVLVTDRRIGFWEAANRPRTIDYPFTVIELRLNGDGEGEGKMSLATKIVAETSHNIVTLENYDTQPVMLKNVRRERASR
jgi:hypothetical protein